MKHKIKASATIEMAYVFSLFCFMFVVCVHIAFYYHDKNILYGTSYEVSVIAAQYIRQNQYEEQKQNIKASIQNNLNKKLLILTYESSQIKEEEGKVVVSIKASYHKLKVHAETSAGVIKPESKLRKWK